HRKRSVTMATRRNSAEDTDSANRISGCNCLFLKIERLILVPFGSEPFFRRLAGTFDDPQVLGFLGQIAHGVEGGILLQGADHIAVSG
ncbi:hypothetical protein, partial [Thiocystis violacea]|uniref:hypothetical protein n=1 Tax=Thiocystis violacea TaxID=13725 RepID=UPI001A91314F